MIGLFRKPQTQVESAQAAAEQNVAKARERYARLQAQHADAQRDLDQHRAGAAQAALDHGVDIDDMGTEIAAQAAMTDALAAALDVAQRDLADAERQLAEIVDSEQRTKSVAKIRRRVDAIPGLSASVITELDQLTAAFKSSAEAYDVCTVFEWLRSVARDVPAMVEHGAKKLNDHARLIEAGGARVILPTSEAHPAEPAIPAALNTKTVRGMVRDGFARTAATRNTAAKVGIVKCCPLLRSAPYVPVWQLPNTARRQCALGLFLRAVLRPSPARSAGVGPHLSDPRSTSTTTNFGSQLWRPSTWVTPTRSPPVPNRIKNPVTAPGN